jgi:diacylglycerol kinase family enzyme
LRRALAGRANLTVHEINFTTLPEYLSTIPSDALVIVAGGDGTFSAVLGSPHMKGREVACIPLGTANDLAREFSITRYLAGARYEHYPHLIRELPFEPCSVWTLHVDGSEVPFVNYVAIGYEGAVVRDFAAWRARIPCRGRLANRIAYTTFGLQHAWTLYKNLSLSDLSGAVRQCPPTTGIIITNIKSHLGMALSNTKSNPGDELIESVSVSTIFGFARMIAAGIGLPIAPSPLLRSNRISIENIPANIPLQIDGESAPEVTDGKLHVTFRHFVQIASAKGAQPNRSLSSDAR